MDKQYIVFPVGVVSVPKLQEKDFRKLSYNCDLKVHFITFLATWVQFSLFLKYLRRGIWFTLDFYIPCHDTVPPGRWLPKFTQKRIADVIMRS
jgi:hypothetical protein